MTPRTLTCFCATAFLAGITTERALHSAQSATLCIVLLFAALMLTELSHEGDMRKRTGIDS